MREFILDEIKRLSALGGGDPPGQQAFETATGIGQHKWRGKYWRNWGDALTDAGFAPKKWVERHDPEAVVDTVVAACRHYGKVPTKSELDLFRASSPAHVSSRAVWSHFGDKAGIVEALAKRAAEQPGFEDIAAILQVTPQPSPKKRPTSKEGREGLVYLIRAGDFFKIGRTDNIERRVREVSIALPQKMELVHAIRTDDPPGIEAYWHHRFKDRRANGEWFRLAPSDVSAFIRRNFQ